MATRISKAQRDLGSRPHALYRFYDRSDVLLYVGITVDLPTRLGNHQTDKPWWLDVARITGELLPSRREVFAAEQKAIRDEKPLYNVQHNEMVDVPDPRGSEGPTRADLDRVEFTAHFEGRRELAEQLLEHLDEDEIEELLDRAVETAEEDEEEGIPADCDLRTSGDYLGRAAVLAMEDRVDQLRGFEMAANRLVESLPPDMRQRCVERAESDLQANMGEDRYDHGDFLRWLVFCIGYDIAKNGVPSAAPTVVG